MKRILLATAALLALGGLAVAQQPGPGAGPGPGMGPGMGRGLMMQQYDTDGDGTISAEEFAAHRQAIFDQADTDKSGTLSRDEFTAGTGWGPGAPSGNTVRDQRREQMHGQMFTTFDTNGDGVLSQEEWATHQTRAPMMGPGGGMGPGYGMGPGMGGGPGSGPRGPRTQ